MPRETETTANNRGDETPILLSPETQLDMAAAGLEPDMRKRLLDFDVNPSGDI